MPSRLAGFVCPTVSMVTTGHATGVEKTLLNICSHIMMKLIARKNVSLWFFGG